MFVLLKRLGHGENRLLLQQEPLKKLPFVTIIAQGGVIFKKCIFIPKTVRFFSPKIKFYKVFTICSNIMHHITKDRRFSTI